MSRFLPAIIVVAFLLSSADSAQAQITNSRTLSASTDRFANLQEQLINRLRATTQDKKDFLIKVVQLVKTGKLNADLVVALERYALRRHPAFPFPYFERALRFESAKRGVTVPTIQQVRSTRVPFPPRRTSRY